MMAGQIVPSFTSEANSMPPSRRAESPSDSELMTRVVSGDERALSGLYDRHAPLVFNLARAVTGGEEDAEEVTEDVFVRLWTGADVFDPDRGSLRSWLAIMARSRALDLVRARERRRRAHERAAVRDDEGVAVSVSGPIASDTSVLQADVRRALDRALSVLSAEQRRVIELAYLGGLTQSEIAETLAEPLGTVKTRIRDGMIRLRDSFKGERGRLA